MDAPHRSPRRTLATLAAALVMSALAVGVTAPVAGAQGTGSLQEQATELQNQIEASDLQIGALAEKLAGAQARQEEAQLKVVTAQAKIAASKAEVERIKSLVEQNLASLYRRTLRGESMGEIDLDDSNDILKRGQYSEAQNSRDDRLLERLRVAQDDLAIQRDEASRARDAAAAEGQQIAAAKASFEAARAQQATLLEGVKGELAAALAAERARREAATKVQFSGGPVNYPDVGPPNGSASQAIAFARGVIGAPYSTNPRTGPSYDCSGLTKTAWGAAGVNIGNASGDQYNRSVRIPADALQPGDLVFWGPGGSSHVGLYIGGGQIIDASSGTGQVVQRGIWGSPSGYGRVT